VDNRNSETLNDLSIKYVLPGSIVVTDGWKGYSPFKRIAQFEHHLVNHSIYFKKSEGKHTNNIEGTWSGVKRTIPVRCRVRGKIQGWLFVFIWRRQHESSNLWNALSHALHY
jgi:hypothetical protein